MYQIPHSEITLSLISLRIFAKLKPEYNLSVTCSSVWLILSPLGVAIVNG